MSITVLTIFAYVLLRKIFTGPGKSFKVLEFFFNFKTSEKSLKDTRALKVLESVYRSL